MFDINLYSYNLLLNTFDVFTVSSYCIQSYRLFAALECKINYVHIFVPIC